MDSKIKFINRDSIPDKEISEKVSQDVLKNRLQAYLRSQSRDNVFIEQFDEGYCCGISTVWLYAKWLQTQPKTSNEPRDDHDWFQRVVNLIINWSEPEEEIKGWLKKCEGLSDEATRVEFFSKLEKADHKLANNLKKIIDNNREIDRFISLIEYFQNIHKYLPAAQGDLGNILKDTKRTLEKEYSIASLFTLEQLKQLLKIRNIVQDKKLILIESNNHATALFKDGEEYYYFNPNNELGEIQTSSVDEIAEAIFEANMFEDNKPSPLGFRIFSFDNLSPKELSKIYQDQKNLLDEIKPILISDKSHADGLFGLAMASRIGCLKSAKYLLEKSVDPNMRDQEDMTALMFAAASGHDEVVKLLLEKGANPNAQNKEDWTALMLAIDGSHNDVVKTLLEKGADHNTQDKEGWTALMLAASNGHDKVVEALLKVIKREDLDIKNNLGQTANDLAIQNKHFVIKDLLYHKATSVNPYEIFGEEPIDKKRKLAILPSVLDSKRKLKKARISEPRYDGDVFFAANKPK